MSPEIDLLTTLSTQPFSACEAQWQQLLRSLFLPISFVPAIQAVLEQGRWRCSQRHATSGSSLEGLSPKPHFASPMFGQVLPARVGLFDQRNLFLSPPAF